MSDKLVTIDINSKGYGVVPKLVMQDNTLDVKAKAIYAYLCSYTGKGDCCYPTVDKICSDLNISLNTYKKNISLLKQMGYINITQVKDSNGKFSFGVYSVMSTLLPQTKICTTATVDQNLGFGNNNIINKKNNSIIKRKNTKKKSEEIIADFLADITDDDLQEAYQAFIDMRAEIKAPITTERMLNILKNKLEKITNDTQKQIELLNEAIFHKWKSVYVTTPKNASKGKITQDYGAFNLDDFERKLNEE